MKNAKMKQFKTASLRRSQSKNTCGMKLRPNYADLELLILCNHYDNLHQSRSRNVSEPIFRSHQHLLPHAIQSSSRLLSIAFLFCNLSDISKKRNLVCWLTQNQHGFLISQKPVIPLAKSLILINWLGYLLFTIHVYYTATLEFIRVWIESELG